MADRKTEVVAVLPESARILMLDVPYCSPKEYARRTGKSESAVSKLVARGKLPIRAKEDGGTATDINLAALMAEALESEGVEVVAVA